MKRAILASIILSVTPLASAIAGSSAIVGKATVIDGDTIEISRERIRLYGIDAPEAKQTCTRADGKRWFCGQEATFALANIIGHQWVYCWRKDIDEHGRIVAVCNLAGFNGPDVGAAMVRQGWAVAWPRRSTDYVPQETAAKTERQGLWAGTFVLPEEWRRTRRTP